MAALEAFVALYTKHKTQKVCCPRRLVPPSPFPSPSPSPSCPLLAGHQLPPCGRTSALYPWRFWVSSCSSVSEFSPVVELGVSFLERAVLPCCSRLHEQAKKWHDGIVRYVAATHKLHLVDEDGRMVSSHVLAAVRPVSSAQ